MSKFIAICALLCSLAYVSAESKSCGQFMYKSDCCAMPKLMPKEVFQGCMGIPNGPLKIEKATTVAGGKIKGSKSGGRNQNNGGGNGGPMCVMECVMRNQSLLSADGLKLDTAAMIEKFAGNANETWKKVITDSVNSCVADLAKVNMVTTPAPPAWMTKVCRAESLFFMTCMRKYLTVSCPASARSADTDKTCAKNIEDLKSCNPFSSAKSAPVNYLDYVKKMAQRAKSGKGGTTAAPKGGAPKAVEKKAQQKAGTKNAKPVKPVKPADKGKTTTTSKQ